MVFKHVLEKLKENPDIDIEEYITDFISKTRTEYDTVKQTVKSLYKKSQLTYNADLNPFI